MAVTGTLKADFTEFFDAITKSNAAMAGMQGGAAKVETSLNKMATGPIAPINSLRTSFGQVDSILMASNINVGRYARGLIEIGDMAGQTVSQIGLLASGISIVSAGMAGWNVGKQIEEWTGLSRVIEWAALKTGMYGDVAAETAGAKQDVLARATANAKREITDYNEAIQINIDAMKTSAAVTADVVRPQSDLMRAWNESAEAADGYTGAWTKLHEASTIYGDGLPEVIEKTKTLTEVLDEILEIQEPIQSGLTFTTETIGELGDEAEDTGKKLEALTLAQQGVTLKGSVKKLTDRDVEKLTNTADSKTQLDALERRRNELETILASYGTRGGPAITSLADYNLMQSQIYQLSQINAYLESHSFAGGVTNFGGGLARVHQDELLVNMPKGTDVIPAGRGGGSTQVIHIHLSGMVGDRVGLARTVQQALVTGARAAGQRLPAGGRT